MSLGGEVNLHGVAEGLRQKENSLAVVGPVGPLTEPGRLADVRRQMVGGILAWVGFGSGQARDDAQQQPGYEGNTWVS